MQKDDTIAKLERLLAETMHAHHAKATEQLTALKLQEDHLLATLAIDQKYHYNLMMLCNVFGSTPEEFDMGVKELCGSDNFTVKNTYLEENIISDLKSLGEQSYGMADDMNEDYANIYKMCEAQKEAQATEPKTQEIEKSPFYYKGPTGLQ